MNEFRDIVNTTISGEKRLMVGFNNIGFDNKVIAADWNILIPDDQCYDILRKIWKAAGLVEQYSKMHVGYGLDACGKANFGYKKTGKGELAPVEWQQGNFAKVIDYCINDIRLTKALMDSVLNTSRIRNPKNKDEFLSIEFPEPITA